MFPPVHPIIKLKVDADLQRCRSHDQPEIVWMSMLTRSLCMQDFLQFEAETNATIDPYATQNLQASNLRFDRKRVD